MTTSTIARPIPHRGAGPRYMGPARPSSAALQVARPMARVDLGDGRARYVVGPRHIFARVATMLAILAALLVIATSGPTLTGQCAEIAAGTDAAPADIVAICDSIGR